MTSKPALRETTTGTRDRNESQGVAHNRIATRSRLTLPEFNVEYDRSPLKNAREALRRANARYGKNDTSAGTGTTSAGEGTEGKVDAKMNDVLARVNTNAASNPFRRNNTEKDDESGRDRESKETDDTAEEEIPRTDADRIDRPTSMLQPPAIPLDFKDGANDGHPKYPKRARSSSFDENSSPSPSGSDHSAGRMPVSGATPPLSPSHLPVAINSTSMSGVEPGIPAASSSSAATFGSNNPKRAKFEEQGTLDTFLARPSSSIPASSQTREKQPQSQQRDVSPTRNFFTEASPGPSSQPDSNSTHPTNNNKPTQVEEAIIYPKMSTIKHLRELPSLDLRKITPSPRKPALKIGFGTPGRKQLLKTRAISEGSTLLDDRASEEGEETGVSKAEAREEDRRPMQGSMKDMEDAQLLQTPTEPLSSSEEKPITQAMEVDAGSHTVEIGNAEAQATAENALPSITVSTSTGTIAYAGSPVKNLKPEPTPAVSLPKVDNSSMGGDPSTPQDKILPSRPLPGGRLPSTKIHLSHVLSLSPLTPLSVLGPLREGSDGYSYGEEAKVVQEETNRAASREAAKLAMQEEAEADADNEDISATPKPLPKFPKMGSPKGSSPAPAGVTRKGSNKGKNKAKLLSTTSRLSTGVSGIKKRGSFVSVSGGLTPRMRMTRAAVLRQKAIQARTPVRTPKDAKKRRTSIFTSMSVSSTVRQANDKNKDKKVPKEGSSNDASKQTEQRKKHAEPEPQRSPRKTFVLTVPSSFSPRKSRSVSSSADSSLTLKSKLLESGPSKPFTFSLYPPSLNDTATTEQAQRALHKLSSALDKLNMPPPPKPSGAGAQLKRSMSEQRERIRPATSLGFARESSVPVSMSQSKEMGRPRLTSRAGSAEPTKKSFFPPPPPPSFGSSLQKDRGKGKALANSSRTAPVAFGSSTSAPASHSRPPSSFRFGLGARGGTTGIFQRPIPRIRASQKPSLETVQGSPVKGAGNPRGIVEDEDEIVAADGNYEQRDTSADADASASSSNANGDTSASSMEGSDTPGVKVASDGTSVNGKELKKISRLNASRRASMAFTALAESLGTSPDTFSPFGLKQLTTDKGTSDEKTPTGSTNNNEGQSSNSSSNSSRPVRAAAPRSFGFNTTGLGRAQSESSVNRSARQRSVTSSGQIESDIDGGARPGSKKSAGGATWRSKMEGSHDALNHCIVFVDVKSDEGEDAGVLFVDMLRALGAKVLNSVGQTLTHIVYKNGMTSTLNRYRLLDEPRPKVVGINWIVECAEAKARVDETRFLVDLESVNVAGVLKRRRSFLPKQITSACTSGPIDAFLNGPGGEASRVSHPVPKACADSDVTSEDGDTSQERLSGGSLTSNMHPLERARKRNATIAR